MDILRYVGICVVGVVLFIQQTKGEAKIFVNGVEIENLNNVGEINVIEGDNLLLECMFDSENTSLTWRKEKSIVSNSYRLEFVRIRKEDGGYYACHMTSSDNSTSENKDDQKQVYIHILYPPTDPILSKPVTALSGEKLSLTCLVEANPEPTYQWRRDAENGLLSSRNRTYELTTSASSITTFCNIQNLMSPTMGEPRRGYVSRKIYITVHRQATISSFGPKRYIDKYVGDDFYHTCYADGNPFPKVWWTKTSDEGVYWVGGWFVSYNIQASFAGEYVCHAENTVVAANKTTMTIHTTEVLYVRVYRNDNNNQQQEIDCAIFSKVCTGDAGTSFKSTTTDDESSFQTTPLPKNSSYFENSRFVSKPASQTPFPSNCSDRNVSKGFKTYETYGIDTFISLSVVAGTGWLLAVLLIVLHVYKRIRENKVERNRCQNSSRFLNGNQTSSQAEDQITAPESAYVSNVRLSDNTYTDLTTYDQISSGRDLWSDTGSVSTETSNVTYIEPTNNVLFG